MADKNIINSVSNFHIHFSSLANSKSYAEKQFIQELIMVFMFIFTAKVKLNLAFHLKNISISWNFVTCLLR